MVETIRKERKLLKKILKYQDPILGIDPESLKISSEDDYLIMLLEAKLIRHTFSATAVERDPRQTWVIATKEGRHLGELNWQETWKFIKRSILVPIAVSAATTLIAIWLHGYFK